MKNRFYTAFFVALIMFLGFLTMPMATLACGAKAGKSCCKKETTKKTSDNAPKKVEKESDKKEKSCCKKFKKHKKTENPEQEGCDGKCKSASCQCSPTVGCFVLPVFNEVRLISGAINHQEKQISRVEIHLSAGFYNIWTPPNIA